MSKLLFNKFTLKALYVASLGKAFLRFRDRNRRSVDRHRVAFYERAWREAAEKLGASFEPLGAGISTIELGSMRTHVRESTSAIDDPATLAILLDKPLTYRILNTLGIPTPRHAAFSLDDMIPAIEFLKGSNRNCVVKPANGTGGGRGVTTGIRKPNHLARSAAWASVYTDELLIEEQIPGDNYRLLYLDGELVDAFVRQPPTVVGDGKSSVRKLVDQANAARMKQGSGLSQILLSIDFEMRRTLAGQGLSLRSVPAAGQKVIVKTVVNDNCGADNSTAMDMLCPSIVEAGERAVRALGVRLAGVDIITTNPAVPLSESGGVMLEVNGPPNFYYHYHKKDGVFPLAEHVLRRILCDEKAWLARQSDDPDIRFPQEVLV